MKVLNTGLLLVAGVLVCGQQLYGADLKIQPPGHSVLGSQPTINPNLAGKMKPFAPGKSNPPKGGGQNQPPWWGPLANPNTWLNTGRSRTASWVETRASPSSFPSRPATRHADRPALEPTLSTS